MTRLYCFNPSLLFSLSADSPDVNNPLILPAGNLSPVIRIRSVREILILFKFILYSCKYILTLYTAFTFSKLTFYGIFLTSRNNTLYHCTACKVFKIEYLFFPIGIRNLQELIFFIKAVHTVNSNIDQSLNNLIRISFILLELRFMNRKIICQILFKYIYCRIPVRTINPYFYIKPPWPQYGRVNKVLPVACSDNYNISQTLNTIYL